MTASIRRRFIRPLVSCETVRGRVCSSRIVWPTQVNCSLRRPLNLPGGTALRLAMRVQKEGKPTNTESDSRLARAIGISQATWRAVCPISTKLLLIAEQEGPWKEGSLPYIGNDCRTDNFRGCKVDREGSLYEYWCRSAACRIGQCLSHRCRFRE